MHMDHTNPDFVKELFFQQMKKHTMHTSFELQHSDAWL